MLSSSSGVGPDWSVASLTRAWLMAFAALAAMSASGSVMTIVRNGDSSSDSTEMFLLSAIGS